MAGGWAVLLMMLAGTVAAQQVPVREETLDNGLRMLMVVRKESPSVAAGWVARVGSVNERPGITGIAHLFEHMMFKGTRTIGTKDAARCAEIRALQDGVRALMDVEYQVLRQRLRRGEISGNIYDPENMTPRLRELKAELEELYAAEKEIIVKDELDQIYTEAGASGLNAFTSNDQTAYFITVPANKLELWFWLESDRLLNPVFREFYSERDVVREERRLRVESTPVQKFEEMVDAMFWQSVPYAHPVIGWPSDVESITREQAETFFETYYAPNNITVVLAGDFDPDQALVLAQRYLGRIPRGPRPAPEVITDEMPQLAERRFTAEADTNPEVRLRFPGVSFYHRDMFPLQLLSDLLSRRTGRLYRELVEEKQVAVGQPYALFRPMKYAGYFEVGAEVREGRRPEEVETALWAELRRLADEAVDEKELQKVKNQAMANSFRRLESNFWLLLQLMIYDSMGDWRFINEAPALLQQVTSQDIQRVAREYLAPEKRNVITFLRKAGTEAADPELAEMPAQMQAMVRQQLAQIATVDDPAKLGEILAQLQGALGQVPPPMKPAVEYIIRKVNERMEALESAPASGDAAEEVDHV